MSMATLQLYQNKYQYPHYSETISSYGLPMSCTPVGMNLKTGSIRVKGDMSDFMSCNYLSLTRDGKTIYAWIDDVQFLNAESFTVSYSVDAWRTYKSKIQLGTQYIARQPESTNKLDKLLGSTQDYPEVKSIMHSWTKGNRNNRVLVVQVMTETTDDIYSNTPVNPTPYHFFFREYNINSWVTDEAIRDLIEVLTGAETKNIVTMYSIPYIDMTSMAEVTMKVVKQDDSSVNITGFKQLREIQDPSQILTNIAYINPQITDMDAFLRVPHSVQIVIPEAGIIEVPDELLTLSDLRLRQDVDLFSGACNYMLESGTESYYTQSVRGSSISSIPIVSDPYDTYISQNQNALATSLIGDVASIGAGVVVGAGTGGLGATVGAGLAASGVNNIVNRLADLNDLKGARPSNPPAFLGTALASNFNQCFWLIVTQKKVTNADQVNAQFGYPVEMAKTLSFPSSGFIQTEACNVYSTDGSVPRWAIDEINKNFDRGILVHSS